MRIFVTGGAGFIGSHTVEVLLHQGHDVVVWDNLSTDKRENLDPIIDLVELCEGDVRDVEALRSSIHRVRPDAILHLAAIPSVQRSFQEPALTHAVNLTGTVHVLEAARCEGVGRVVLASSAAVYGDDPALPKNEAMLVRPLSPYGFQKWQSEQYAEFYSTRFGLTTISLRYFNVFGPRQDPRNPYSGVISIFLDRLLTGGRIVIHGDGDQTRDFVYVADVAAANARALTTPLSGYHKLNIGRNQETSILGLHDLLRGITGCPSNPVFAPPRPGDILRSSADVSRAEAALGFAPQYTVEEGLERLVEWYGPLYRF